MSAPESPDSLEFLVNGKPAVQAEMDAMETFAADLLEAEPSLLQRECGYLVEETGALVLFRSFFDESDDVDATWVSVSVGRVTHDGSKFYLSFGYDNMPTELTGEDEDELLDAFFAADELLEADIMSPAATAVVAHTKDIIEWVMGHRELEHVGRLGEGQGAHMADVIRELVEQSSTTWLSLKEYSKALDDDHVISVIGHVVCGDVNLQDIEDIPAIQIMYEDRAEMVGYCYARTLGGIVGLETFDPRHMFEEENDGEPDDLEEDSQEVFAALRDALQVPSHDAVRVLTGELQEAMAAENFEIFPIEHTN